MKKRWEVWEKKNRVHIRGLTAHYSLKEERERLRQLPRVIKAKDVSWEGGPLMFNKILLDPSFGGPQTIYVHLMELVPGAESQIHGHQNGAMTYILEGSGYSYHDGQKFKWKAGDLAIIPTECVHQHVCTSEKPARVLLFKAKPLYMFCNLLYQDLVRAAKTEPIPGWENYKPEE